MKTNWPTKNMKLVIAGVSVILFLSFITFVALQIKGVIVLSASPERCAKLRSVLSDEQIVANQDYWDKRCGKTR